MISDDAATFADATGSDKGQVKGFATIDHVALINVEGTGMARPRACQAHTPMALAKGIMQPRD